ncbi:hypothetical protein DJ568_09280 [Mucilaginibacter hurinus]|uniref:Glycoside hydrolase family 5 domain-containing protein n=1 Tax=Mucilaginibacter hurinus TaxID=2201324 RepID=A0A367GPE4_9SPHI|nr:cellulase family glycosylhydrolase [Mucilaginibacter hurinus]RCH55362.1 hypothetical protein DJ568_09280 [Mucilaginibacter hurinus]
MIHKFSSCIALILMAGFYPLHVAGSSFKDSSRLDWIQVSEDSTCFINKASAKKFVAWGVNYDHDSRKPGRLIEDYWISEWDTVVADFKEMKQLGANVVRVHLQLPKFMDSANSTNPESLNQLARLIKLAESIGLYLDITGLACYRKNDIPEWYVNLDDAGRWQVQAYFWEAVAKVCKDSPAVFCYGLMNEPLIPAKGEAHKELLAGELGGFYYNQRLVLNIGERTQKQVAKEWIEKMVAAIRRQDSRHMVTLGVIPLAFYFPGAQPLFYDRDVCAKLDFVSVHFYPKHNEVDKALAGLKLYDIGKPLVIEEIFGLECTVEDADAFIEGGKSFADGWISFYWGKTIEELASTGKFGDTWVSNWFKYFKNKSVDILQTSK